MAKGIKHILKVLGLILGGSLAGALLLALVFMMPVNVGNKVETFGLLEEEGWYPATPMHKQAYAEYFHSYLPGVMDNNTDAIMLSTAMDENAGNPLVRAMNMFNDYLGIDYGRYWHGYVSVLRPMLYFFDYAEIRILNGILQILIMFLLMHHVWQKKGMRYALLMLTSYVLLMPLAMAVSLQFSWIFYVGTLACLTLLAKGEYWGEKYRFLYLFVLVGMLTSYFDLLTYPLFTWGFPVIWWLLADRTPTTRRGYVERCVGSGIGWVVGYLGMWGMKWVLASVITGRNIIEEAVGKVQEHSASLEGKEFTLFARLEAAYTNWKHYEYSVYFLLLVVWLLVLVVLSFKKGWRLHLNNPGLLLAAASSPLWYFVLAEHTRGHHFFTYRIWNVTILAVLAILLQATDTTHAGREFAPVVEESGGVWKSRIRILALWAVAAVCGLALMLTAKEPLGVLNGDAESMEISMSEEAVMEMDFIPTYSKVTEIGFMLRTTRPDGICEMLVSKGDKVLYREQLPLEAFLETGYAALEVDWNLKANEIYQIRIMLKDIREAVATVVTAPALLPLNELRNLVIAGQETDSQPIMGITYSVLPISRKTLLFLLCGFGTACAALLLVCTDIKPWLKERKNRVQKNIKNN